MDIPDTQSDSELARAAQGGSREAFAELTLRHYQPVHSFLISLLDNRADAEDLTQDTFLRALAKIRQFKPGHPFRPWIFTIARRIAITHWRRRKPTVPLDESTPHPAAAAPLSQHDAAALWSVARQKLKPDEFSALWFFYREDLSIKELAKVLRKTTTHTKVILHRARTHLRDHLEPDTWRPAPAAPAAIQTMP